MRNVSAIKAAAKFLGMCAVQHASMLSGFTLRAYVCVYVTMREIKFTFKANITRELSQRMPIMFYVSRRDTLYIINLVHFFFFKSR